MGRKDCEKMWKVKIIYKKYDNDLVYNEWVVKYFMFLLLAKRRMSHNSTFVP